MAVLIYLALIERRNNGRRVPAPALLAVVPTAVFGLLDESVQVTLPNRVYDVVDVGFNALAGLMAIAGSPRRGVGAPSGGGLEAVSEKPHARRYVQR